MTDERRPTANEYKLLEKLAGGTSCWRTLGGEWYLRPRLGPLHNLSDNTASGLRRRHWVKLRYARKEELTYLELTDAGEKVYEDERRRRLETQT